MTIDVDVKWRSSKTVVDTIFPLAFGMCVLGVIGDSKSVHLVICG